MKKTGKKKGMDPNILIAIIGSLTTIAVVIIPWWLDRLDKSAEEPTPLPTTAIPVDLDPTSTFTLTPAPATPTEAVTVTPSVQTGIFDIYLARDEAGLFKRTTFQASETIFIVFSINDPLGRNAVRVAFRTVDVPGFTNGSEVYYYENVYEGPTEVLKANPTGALKPGTYTLELSLNGELDETIEFEITR